jgi:hypothetical protein
MGKSCSVLIAERLGFSQKFGGGGGVKVHYAESQDWSEMSYSLICCMAKA